MPHTHSIHTYTHTQYIYISYYIKGSIRFQLPNSQWSAARPKRQMKCRVSPSHYALLTPPRVYIIIIICVCVYVSSLPPCLLQPLHHHPPSAVSYVLCATIRPHTPHCLPPAAAAAPTSPSRHRLSPPPP